MFPSQGKRDRICLCHCSVPVWWPEFVFRVCLVSNPLIIICDEELTVLLEFNCFGKKIYTILSITPFPCRAEVFFGDSDRSAADGLYPFGIRRQIGLGMPT